MQITAKWLQRLAMYGGIMVTTGGVALFVGSYQASDYPLRVAMMLFMAGITTMGVLSLGATFRTVTRPAEDAYDLGHDLGYDKGYAEGRATARPAVVPMASRSTCLECDDRRLRERFIAERRETPWEATDGVYPETPLGEVAVNDSIARWAAQDPYSSS